MEENKEENQVASVFKAGEKRMSAKLAETALDIVKPFLTQCRLDIERYIGDDKVVIMRKSNKNAPMSIIVLDTKEDFTIKGGSDRLGFTGAAIPGTNKLKAIQKYFTAEEFVDLLIGGKMDELSKKLTS